MLFIYFQDDQPSSSINSVETDDRDRESEGSGEYYDELEALGEATSDEYVISCEYYDNDHHEEDFNSHKDETKAKTLDETNWKDDIINKNDKSNNYNSWNTDNVNTYDNYNLNNDDDIHFTDDVKTTIQVQQVTGILTAVVAVVGLLCAILLVMYIGCRMRHKDDESHSLV